MTHQHVNRDGGRKDTVNWLQVHVDGLALPTDTIGRGDWHDGTSRHLTLQMFNPRNPDFESLRTTAFSTFVGQAAAGLDVLAHPHVAQRPRRTEVTYMQPVLNVNTASNDDIDTTATEIKNAILSGTEMILIVGDQQTYERLFHLKVKRGISYQWCLPLPGEWHFTVHALMALHSLWYQPLAEGFVAHLHWENSIVALWTSVEKYVYYDRFWQLLVWGFTEYMARVVPTQYRSQPRQLLYAVRHNPTAVYAVSFLFEFGLPWLHLRHAIRAGQSSILDVMWLVTFHWFRAVGVRGKYKYALMSVYVTFFRHGAKAQLRALWAAMRTASLCGHPGRNVPWDFVLERMNREAKQFLGGNPTDEQLERLHELLNALRHMGPRFDAATGQGGDLEEDEGSQYSHQLDADKQAVLEYIFSKLGADWDAMRGRSSRQQFQHRLGSRLENPSKRVARKAGAAAGDEAADTPDDGQGDDQEKQEDDDDDGGGGGGASSSSSDEDGGGDGDEEWCAYVRAAQKKCPKK